MLYFVQSLREIILRVLTHNHIHLSVSPNLLAYGRVNDAYGLVNGDYVAFLQAKYILPPVHCRMIVYTQHFSDGYFSGRPRISRAYAGNGAESCRCDTHSTRRHNDVDCLVAYVARDGSVTLHCIQRDVLGNCIRCLLRVLFPTSATYAAAACRCTRSVAKPARSKD